MRSKKERFKLDAHGFASLICAGQPSHGLQYQVSCHYDISYVHSCSTGCLKKKESLSDTSTRRRRHSSLVRLWCVTLHPQSVRGNVYVLICHVSTCTCFWLGFGMSKENGSCSSPKAKRVLAEPLWRDSGFAKRSVCFLPNVFVGSVDHYLKWPKYFLTPPTPISAIKFLYSPHSINGPIVNKICTES